MIPQLTHKVCMYRLYVDIRSGEHFDGAPGDGETKRILKMQIIADFMLDDLVLVTYCKKYRLKTRMRCKLSVR